MENNTKASVGRNLKGFIPPTFGGRHEQRTMKTKLRQTIVKMVTNSLIALALPFIISNNVNASTGKLYIDNRIDSYFTSQYFDFMHSPDASEGYDSFDSPYTELFDPSGITSKIVSIVQGHKWQELDVDARPVESTTPVDIELSLNERDANRGDPITISSENKLVFYLPLSGDPWFYDFGLKPITLKQYEPNDPNVFYPLYDIRQIIAHQNGPYNSGIIELPPLNGTHGSEVPYAYFKLYFDRFSGDLNYDKKVDGKDFAIFAAEWNATDVNSVTDIFGPNGTPDKNVDFYDLGAFVDDYLKDSNDPNTW